MAFVSMVRVAVAVVVDAVAVVVDAVVAVLHLVSLSDSDANRVDVLVDDSSVLPWMWTGKCRLE